MMGTALLLTSATAAACPLCIGTAARSSSQDLDELTHAVLAVPAGKQYRVSAVIKGAAPAGSIRQVVVHETTPAGQSLLLVRDAQWPMWMSLGRAAPEDVPALRVLAAYMAFIHDHPDMAGFVAADLAAWRYWDAAPEFAAILKSNVRQHDDSRAQMVAYLRQSPTRWSE